MIVNGTTIPLSDIGFVFLPSMTFVYDYYIPKLILSLTFVSELCDHGYSIMFSFTSFCMHDLYSEMLIYICYRQRELYILDKLDSQVLRPQLLLPLLI